VHTVEPRCEGWWRITTVRVRAPGFSSHLIVVLLLGLQQR
jgi:hypothetical protein